MKIPILSAWLNERRFDREHRPFLETRLPDAILQADGSTYQPGLMLIWCRLHACWFNECPKP